jgi:uncharacterized protein (TIGR02996 family)
MSTERAALIAAIREAPDDDDLRLVCADWFEDQGDEVNVAHPGGRWRWGKLTLRPPLDSHTLPLLCSPDDG